MKAPTRRDPDTVINIYDDPVKEIAAAIQKAMNDGVLGFAQGTTEFSRVRSCCSWLLEGKPEKLLFVKHLSRILLKGESAVARGFGKKLLSFVIKREPVAAPVHLEEKSSGVEAQKR